MEKLGDAKMNAQNFPTLYSMVSASSGSLRQGENSNTEGVSGRVRSVGGAEWTAFS